MKKKICLLLTGIIAISLLTGCSSKPKIDSQGSDSEETKAEEAKEADIKEEGAKDQAELVIESWRADDIKVWQDIIIPAYEKSHSNVKVKFNGVLNTEYGTTLQTKLSADNAGDLIMVEPYDFRSNLYTDGALSKLNEVEGVNNENFEDWALSAWSTDSGDIFGVPLASAIHGFIYNKAIFEELKLEVPKTTEEFFGVMDRIKEDGKYVPLAMGTASDFVTGVLGVDMVLPTFIKGEEGRLGLINGNKKFTDPEFVSAWSFVKQWTDYMPDGYEAITYSDMQNMFMMGQAAIFPAGSWEIPIFGAQIKDSFEYGAFPVPVQKEGDKAYVNNHPDMGMAMNAKAKNPEQAKEFLTWMTTKEFAELWNNAMPGFYNLTTHEAPISDPLANQFLSWTKSSESSPRLAYQILSRGEPNTDAEMIRLTVQMLNKTMTPEEVCAQLQQGLDSWYTPAK